MKIHSTGNSAIEYGVPRYVSISMYMWVGSLLCFIPLFLLKAYCDTEYYSRKIVENNDIMPNHGVPDFKNSPYSNKELVSEKELITLLRSNEANMS